MPSDPESALLAAFERLDVGTKEALADIEAPLQLALAVLTLAQDRAGQDHLSLDQIADAAEAAGVAVKRASLAKAIARAGSRVSRREIGGEPHFRVMLRGRREAEPLLTAGNIGLVYVAGDQPRTSRKALGDVMGDLNGTVRICDPYFGTASLDALELIPKGCQVRLLTAQVTDAPARLKRPLRDFQKEYPNVEIRLHPDPKDLHDRYVTDDESLLLIGHGLKDLGGKESFIIRVPKDAFPEVAEEVEARFDQRWANAEGLS